MLWFNDFPRSCAVSPLAHSFAGDSPADVHDFIAAQQSGCMASHCAAAFQGKISRRCNFQAENNNNNNKKDFRKQTIIRCPLSLKEVIKYTKHAEAFSSALV